MYFLRSESASSPTGCQGYQSCWTSAATQARTEGSRWSKDMRVINPLYARMIPGLASDLAIWMSIEVIANTASADVDNFPGLGKDFRDVEDM